jgi:predicted transcriptional regulator
VIGPQLTSDEQLAFVFPPGSDLVAPVNAALESMQADGTLQTINDKWMKENGFLEPEWNETPLGEILAAKPSDRLIASWTSDRMTDVIARMKERDISQMPVLNADGTLAGLVSEVDLLKHLLEAGHTHKPEETIESIVEPSIPVFTSTLLEDVCLLNSQSSCHKEDCHDLTKIDVLDFMARRYRAGNCSLFWFARLHGEFFSSSRYRGDIQDRNATALEIKADVPVHV